MAHVRPGQQANRRVIVVMRGRLERGEPVARMYGPL
jgi:hypothetical protein